MTSIELVPFHGDMLQAVRDERGGWAVLRTLCEALGLDANAQSQRLRRQPPASRSRQGR
jgi:prophage antirepressor-like protein